MFLWIFIICCKVEIFLCIWWRLLNFILKLVAQNIFIWTIWEAKIFLNIGILIFSFNNMTCFRKSFQSLIRILFQVIHFIFLSPYGKGWVRKNIERINKNTWIQSWDEILCKIIFQHILIGNGPVVPRTTTLHFLEIYLKKSFKENGAPYFSWFWRLLKLHLQILPSAQNILFKII